VSDREQRSEERVTFAMQIARPEQRPSTARLWFGRIRSREVAGLVAAAFVAVGLLVWGAHMGRAGEAAGNVLWPAGGGSIVVWRSTDGSLTARMTGAAGAATLSSLGVGSDARLIAGGARPVVLVTEPGGGHRLVGYAPASYTWSTIASSLDPAEMTTAALAHGLAYLPVNRGSRQAVIAVRGDGRTAARFPLSTLKPAPSLLGTLTGTGDGAAKAGRSRVAALLPAGGDVLAITTSPAAAALTDLRTRARVSLAGYTQIVAAAVGGDGIVYILAGRADPAFSLRFLRVDPHGMRVLSAWDTGVAATQEPGSALPTRFGAVFYVPGVPDSLDASSGTNVWLVDASGARQNSTVSSNVGVRMGPGRGDSVLFYGAPAGGVVTRLDIDDGVLSRASARLSTPSGATVLLAAD